MLNIDPTAKISPLADIEDSTRGTLIQIGARTVIDSFVKIKPAGGMGDVVIGCDCAYWRWRGRRWFIFWVMVLT